MAKSTGAFWECHNYVIAPRSAREAMAVLGSIGVFSSRQHFAWRGMSSTDHALTSSLHRALGRSTDEESLREAELRVLQEARRWGLGLHGATQVDDLQLLADLQHYGIPTRLIDFTSNPMTALWFACQTSRTPKAAASGVLLALDVAGWPRLSTAVEEGVTWGSVEDPQGARLSGALASNSPFVVDVALKNDRMRAQEGFFVASSLPVQGLERRATPFWSLDLSHIRPYEGNLAERLLPERSRGAPGTLPYVAVIIGRPLKSKLLKYLTGTYNRTPDVLFPDFDGFREFGTPL